MTNTSPDHRLDTVPAGTIELASSMLGPAARHHDLTDLLLAPRRLDRSWPSPTEPTAVAGGWIHADVIDQDRPLLEAVIDRHGGDGPEAVAGAAQTMRLPVTPYRTVNGHGPLPGFGVGAEAGVGPGVGVGAGVGVGVAADIDLTGAVVVDLTTHWAGPLATKLLADTGASMIKVDPRCRPDGFGDRPAVYHHLNGNKQIIDLDLRDPEDRSRFDQLLSTADLLVESFSRRVMTNLGYHLPSVRAAHRSLRTLSIKAFDLNTPEADWLAYGPGVHAASGLGFCDADGRPRPASVAYPDFLTGIAGYVSACRLLRPGDRAGHERTGQARHAELAMESVIRPLVTGQPGRQDRRG